MYELLDWVLSVSRWDVKLCHLYCGHLFCDRSVSVLYLCFGNVHAKLWDDGMFELWSGHILGCGSEQLYKLLFGNISSKRNVHKLRWLRCGNVIAQYGCEHLVKLFSLFSRNLFRSRSQCMHEL